MVVIVTEKVPRSLRGELTRWLLEVKTNTFVGKLSAMVRDKVWELVESRVGKGGAMLIHNTNNEQGFTFLTTGEMKKEVVDYEGVFLIRSKR